MMRIGNNYIYYDIMTWNFNFYPTPMSLFYLRMVEHGHIPCRHMVKKYEGHAL